jgi:hypothetical protein
MRLDRDASKRLCEAILEWDEGSAPFDRHRERAAPWRWQAIP